MEMEGWFPKAWKAMVLICGTELRVWMRVNIGWPLANTTNLGRSKIYYVNAISNVYNINLYKASRM